MKRNRFHHPLSLATLPLAVGVVAGGLFVTLLTVRQVQYGTNLRPKALDAHDVHATPRPSPGGTCYQRRTVSCTTNSGLRGTRSCIFTRRSTTYPYSCNKDPISCTTCQSITN